MLRASMALLALGGFASLGCFKTAQLNLGDGRERFEQQRAEERPAGNPLSPETITVAVRALPSLGCVIEPTKDEREADDLGSIRCAAFQLPGSATADAVEERAETIPGNAGHGYFLTAFPETVTAVMTHRLSQRFTRADVRLVQSAADRRSDEIGLEITELLYYGGGAQTSGRSMKVTFAVTLPDGRELQVSGLGRIESQNGQLGWMIPLSLVLFPVGLIPSGIVAGNIHADHVRRAFWVGLDDASKQLASELLKAGPPRPPPPPPPPAPPPSPRQYIPE